MPHQLRLVGWAAFEDRLPLDAEQLQECLAQMQDELPSLAADVSYETGLASARSS
jgi:hypothetical protein